MFVPCTTSKCSAAMARSIAIPSTFTLTIASISEINRQI